jgi:ankyrin repeat protein
MRSSYLVVARNEDLPLTNLPIDLIKSFICAVTTDQAQALEMLTEHAELLNARCMHDATVLHYLTTNGCFDGVLFLARCGADVNARNRFGDPPLLDAAMLGNYPITKTLLEHGADPNAQSSSFETPIICAVRSGSANVVELLLENGADSQYRSPNGKTIFDVLPPQNKLRLSIYRILEKYAAQPGDDRRRA